MRKALALSASVSGNPQLRTALQAVVDSVALQTDTPARSPTNPLQ
jgi:hypothetical protein